MYFIQRLSEFVHLQICCRIGLISQVGVILQGKRELTVSKVWGRNNPVVQPLKKVTKWKKPLIEGKHSICVYVSGLRCRGTVQLLLD